MNITLVELRARIREWLLQTLGHAVTYDSRERARRVLEEALELAQAEGVTLDKAIALSEYVYARPVGDKRQEAAGVLFCILAWAAAGNVDLDEDALYELFRVERLDPNIVRRKHQQKYEAGLAMPGTPPEGPV